MSSDRALVTMENHQGLAGPPERPINGSKVPTNLLAKDIPAETRQTSTDRDATRYLSAATQIDIGYAERVAARVMNEPFRALAPTYGVDVAVVTMWALKALRTRALRDNTLAAVFVLIIPRASTVVLLAARSVSVPGYAYCCLVDRLLGTLGTYSSSSDAKNATGSFRPRKAPSPHRERDRARLSRGRKTPRW